jgi:uncharacterized protein (TIGR02646 family)
MRPVDKGAHPLHADGKPVVFASYGDAAPYLRERLGRFCSYCERKIPVNLAVEHVVPKSQQPALEKDWGNFLLACTNCNSHKRDKPVEPADYLWPDTDDTLAAFTYEPSGAIKVAAGLDSQQQVKAQALLSLVGLDKSPAVTTAADYRHKDRLEQWGKARVALDMLALAPDHTRDKTRAAIVALATDGYSIWATVFRDDLDVLRALQQKYPGTRTR